MTNRVHIICHPRAGGGRGNIILKRVQDELNSFQIEHLTYLTNYTTHAEVLTEQLIHRSYKDYEHNIIVVGGDGTLHEVVQTLIRYNKRIPITFVPAGTGNDFYRTWQKKQSIREIIETMLFSHEPKMIPVFQYINHNTQKSGVILNNMGFGFDGEVNFRAQSLLTNSFFGKTGIRKLSYLLSVLLSLPNIRHFSVSGEIDKHQFHYDDVSIATILNTPTLGGGINIDQMTQAENNEIALVLYHDINWASVPDLLNKVLITKKTYESENIHRYTGQALKLSIKDPIRGHVDGEVLPEMPVNIEVSLTNYPFYLPN